MPQVCTFEAVQNRIVLVPKPIRMNDSNVIPFRKRPPSEMELEVYERMTRNWTPELRELMFPEHFKREQARNEG